jgi:hypothetical protein
MDVYRFNLKKLNEGGVKEQYQVTIKTDFQLWRTWRIMGTLIGHWTLLERI